MEVPLHFTKITSTFIISTSGTSTSISSTITYIILTAYTSTITTSTVFLKPFRGKILKSKGCNAWECEAKYPRPFSHRKNIMSKKT